MNDNDKLKKEYRNNLKQAFSIIENNDSLIKLISLIYKSCNFTTNRDINSLIFMEGRRSLYQNLFIPFMSNKLRSKVEVFNEDN